MIGGIGYTELIVLAVVAVMLFGPKLTEVARNVGNSYAQFRKGLNELQTSIKVEDDENLSRNLEYERSYDDVVEPSGPKFEPPVEDESPVEYEPES